MVAFIGNILRGKVSVENFDESIANRQNSSDFSSVKILRYTVYMLVEIAIIEDNKHCTTHSLLAIN